MLKTGLFEIAELRAANIRCSSFISYEFIETTISQERSAYRRVLQAP